MKNKRLIASLLAVLMVLSLSGCQLAREDAGEGAGSDRFIGVFITTEYLDLLDFEGDTNDNLDRPSGGEIKIDGEGDVHQGRLYATLTERTLTSEETGAQTTIEEYEFDRVSGISYFSAQYAGTNGVAPYRGNASDEGISDGSIALDYGDNEERISLECTIYVSPMLYGQTYCFNPVYQSADGRVYAMSGSGFTVSGEGATGEGAIYSQTMDEETTVTENGEMKTVATSVKISIVSMYTPEQIAILQMDEDSNIVARNVFPPEDVPEKLDTHEDVEYIIIETYKTDSEGAPVVTRELFDQEDDALSAFYCRDDGVCVKKWIQID